MMPSRGSASDEQAADPEVSSKKEKSNARHGESEKPPNIEEKVPTMQVKNVTKAQTDMTEYAADTTDDANTVSALFLSVISAEALNSRTFLFLGRISIPMINPANKTVQ